MKKEKKETKIAVQVPEKLQEEFAQLKEEYFFKNTEEELYWLAVRAALDNRKSKKREENA